MTRNIIINILLLFIYFIISNTYLFNMKIADKLYNIKRFRNTDEMYLSHYPRGEFKVNISQSILLT